MKNSKVIFPILCGFFVMGFVDLVGISTNYVKSDFGLSDSVANLLPMMVFVWFALFSIPTGLLMGKLGRRNTVLAGMILTVAAMVMPMVAYSYGIMLLSFAMLGIGNTVLQVALNPMAASVVAQDRISSVLTWGQFIKAASSLLGPVAAGVAASVFMDWKLVFPALGLVTLLSALWMWLTVPQNDSGENEQSSFSSTLKLFGDGFLLLCFLSIVCIVGVDVGLNTTIPQLLMNRAELPLSEAGLGTSLYFASRMGGTFVGALLLTRIASRVFLKVSVLLSLVAFALLMTGSSLWILCGGVVLVGLACANVFSVVFALALERKPEAANEVSALMIIGVAGGALIPPVMGLISDSFGLTAGLGVLPLCMVLIGFTAFLRR